MLHVIVGAALGAVLGAAGCALSSALRGKPIDWRSVGAAALGGAVAGGVTALTCGAGLLAGTAVARTGGMVLAGAGGGFSEQAADNLLHGRRLGERLGRSTAEGAALGAAGAVARVSARPVASLARRVDLARLPDAARASARAVGTSTRGAARAAKRRLGGAWGRYLEALEKRPRRTQALTSGAFTATGDVIAQATEGRGFDWKRTAYRTAWATAWSATLGWNWTLKLEKWFPARTWKTTFYKVALDQLLVSPASGVPYYFGYGVTVEGESGREAWRRVTHTLPRTTALSLQVWPLASAVKYRWVPATLQGPFSKLLGLVYNVASSRVAFAEPQPVADRPLGEDGPPAPMARVAIARGAVPGDTTAVPASRDEETGPAATSHGLVSALPAE